MSAGHTQVLPRAAVSISAMARTVGLSRSRFYDHVRCGVFPQPVYCLVTRRPMFLAEMQEDIMQVRQSGIGVNGQYVLFYDRRPSESPVTKARKPARPNVGTELLEGLRSLGLATVTSAQVEAAVSSTYPDGTGETDRAIVLRTIFRHLRRLGTV